MNIRHYFHNERTNENELINAVNPILGEDLVDAARAEIQQWANYQKTPLHNLNKLATNIGVGAIYFKDEANRFGMGSFKALGGAYAVSQLLQQEIYKQTGKSATSAEIRRGEYKEITNNITVATATDGNHGRSVAWGAQQFNCQCVIYIHADVSIGRKTAMEAFGAKVIRVDGNYDESVHQAARDAKTNDWYIVSDTSYPGYTELPRFVMAGYTVMSAEACNQLDVIAPTHVIVQGGVGGLAAAICAHHCLVWGSSRPRFIIVEPTRADCLYQSALNGKPTVVDIVDESIMAGLSCGEVSELAWRVLEAGAHDFITVSDDVIAPMMQQLADGVFSGYTIVSGESAVPGLAALIAAMDDKTLSQQLGLDENSRVLIFGTEGATDPEIYESLVGRPVPVAGEAEVGE